MAVSEAQLKAIKKYEDANVRRVSLKLNLKTDADIVSVLDRAANKQRLMKDALRLWAKENPDA